MRPIETPDLLSFVLQQGVLAAKRRGSRWS
jgi:hypothetical protein